MTDASVAGYPVETDDLSGRIYPGLGPGPHHGVLVLHGGGGAGGYERSYAERLAQHGFTALCVDYFGAPGVPSVLAEIPLSYFAGASDWLLRQPNVSGNRVSVVGFSRGGEAALLVSALLDRIAAVVAYVPSCYAFPAPTWMDGIEEEGPAWTMGGDQIPYLPVDKHVEEPQEGITDALGEHAPNAARRATNEASAEELERATIPVENIDGPVLLVSGGSDEVWPSTEFANRVIERLERFDHQWEYEHLAYPDAGHAIRVPYQPTACVPPAGTHWLGGTNAANAYASADAWHGVLDHLDQ